MKALDEKTLHKVLHRGVLEIIPEEEFVSRLKEGVPLRLKMGFDPTKPDIHLGHVVGLRKLRQLQELGHQVILIVGDWTAQIGDPSGQSATRSMLTAEEVRSNAETYMRQFFKVVDKERAQAVWQSEWFGKFGLADVIRLTSKFTVAQFLAREDFGNRFKEGRPIAITELLYPLMQAHDSVAIKADVEFGGSDQRFNLLVGRELQQMMGQRPQQCFIMPILIGTDGVQKMSKSLGNYIGVEEPPRDMYGKIMSLPDTLIMDYFELVTDVSDEELQEFRQQLVSSSVNPMLLKKRLAREIVTQFHSASAAGDAERYFEIVVQKKVQVGGDVTVTPGTANLRLTTYPPEVLITTAVQYRLPAGEEKWLSRILLEAGLVKSASEGRRLISQRAVEVDGAVVEKDYLVSHLEREVLVKVGKRRYLRLLPPNP